MRQPFGLTSRLTGAMRDNPHEVTAVVLAGGLGTRLRSVVADLPKPMAPIAGTPFIAHLLRYWRSQGVGRFVLSVGYLHKKILDYIGSSFEGCDVEYVVESAPLGTGGALLGCIAELHLTENFLLLNGDTYFEVDLSSLISAATRASADWTLSLFSSSDPERFLPIELGNSGRIERLENSGSTGTQHKSRWANGGVYWVNPISAASSIFKNSCSLENDLLPEALAKGDRIFGLPQPGIFIDIGVPDDFARAQKMRVFDHGVGK